MLSPRWTKVLRDLLSHRFRTALVVLSIAIGIFAVTLVMGGRQILVREFDSEFAASRPKNAAFYTMPFDDPIVRRAAEYPGVLAAQGRHTATFRYRWLGAAAPRSLSVIAFRDYGNITVERVVPENVTHWPPRRGEIVLEAAAMKTGNYQIGDIFEIEMPDREPVKLTVSGFAHDVNAIPAQFLGGQTGYIAFDELPVLGQSETYNQLLISMKGDALTQRSASLLAQDIKRDVFEASGIQVLAVDVPKPGSHFLGDIFKAVSLLLLALGILILLLSGFLVVNTISALMAQHVRQVGIMKAVGGRAIQVTWMYLGMVAIYGILAVLIGLPASAYAGRLFTQYAAGVLNFRVSSYIPAGWVILLGVGVGLVVPLLAAIVPIRAGTRTSVVRALNATGVSSASFGHGLVDRALGLLRGLPRPVALSLRNTFLRKGRLAMTLATLSLASGVVMGVFSVQASINQSIDDLDAWWRYQAQIRFEQPVDRIAAERPARSVAGVADVESWIMKLASLERPDGSRNEALQVMALVHNTTFVAPTLVNGRWLEAGDADAIVVNTDARKAEPALDVGKRVNLEIDGKEHTWRVVGVVTGQLSGPLVFVDRDTLGRVLGDVSVTQMLIKTTSSDPDLQRRTLDRVEKRLEDAGYSIASTRTQVELRAQIADELGILMSFLVIMATLLAGVGVIGLTGTMSINVIESTREIGVMRAIGAGHNAIYQIFITEGLVVGLMSWAIGALLAYPVSRGLTSLLSGAMGIPLSYRFSWSGVGTWLGVIALISIVASLTPAFRASQVSVRDAIAYE